MLPGVGVFGTSLTARVIIPLLKDEGFAVKALWGRTQEEAEELAKEMSVPFYTSRIDEVLLHQDVDLVCINLPPPLTRQIAVKTLGERPPPPAPAACLPSLLLFCSRPLFIPEAYEASTPARGPEMPQATRSSLLPRPRPSQPLRFSPPFWHHLDAPSHVCGAEAGGGVCSRDVDQADRMPRTGHGPLGGRGNSVPSCACSAPSVCVGARLGEASARPGTPETRAPHVCLVFLRAGDYLIRSSCDVLPGQFASFCR